MHIKNAIKHFIEFHKGAVNIALHIIGFAGMFYSIMKMNWILFSLSLIILESGHIYNHYRGIQKYEGDLKVNVWRTIIFITVVAIFYFVTSALS